MTIAGYTVTERVREEGALVFSRAHREEDERPVFTLVLSCAEGANPLAERLAREYALREELDPCWAIQPLSLERREGAIALVLDSFDGLPMACLLGQPWPIAQFLRVAVGITRALHLMHERELIHKDIKPANILVDLATAEVRFTGFGLASRLPRERQAPQSPEIIAGTLAYMAPEQTGRMNRSIDSRSDLYSLGVTFYEMLTAALPFSATEPADWIHCHVARLPAALTERRADISPTLSAIVMKLLAKDAQDRYQTAAGLEADLQRCLESQQATGQIAPFTLAQHDVSDKLLIPEKLYGRSREIAALLAAFESVVSEGTPELVLVSGYSGIGKSALVSELHKAMVLPRGSYVAGKFDQYQRDVPYATLAQAFQKLLLQALRKPLPTVTALAENLRKALGTGAALIVNLVPELELLIGPQQPVAELPPQEALTRFQAAIQSFVGVFATADHPLVLFLDDLQWLDAATLRLLEHLVTDPQVRHLLLIGAYRDNEVGPSHPLMQTLSAIRTEGGRLREIVLAPLHVRDTGHLVADALRCDFDRALPLAELIQKKTAGNPFFIIQFLTALVDDQELVFDTRSSEWRWDLGAIQAKGMTDNVVELMIRKLNRLPAKTQHALKQLACLGHRVSTATLATAHGITASEIEADLWEAVRAGLVQQADGAYEFTHDRVHEAAYALVPHEQRPNLHLEIGRRLAALMNTDEATDNVFEVVNQLDSGASLIVEQGERDWVAELNLIAGRKAKASAAYASARHYFAVGLELLGTEGFVRRYELWFNLGLECAECEYLNGEIDKAQQLIAQLMQHARSKVDKAKAYRLKIELHVTQSENAQAVDSALECLTLFGITMPPHPTRAEVQTEYDKVLANLDGRSIESLAALPMMTDPEMQAAMQVLSVLFAPAFFLDVNLACLQVCHMVNVTLKSGTTDASAHGYGWFGMLLGPLFQNHEDRYRFGELACNLAEQPRYAAYKAKAYFCMELISVWTKPLELAMDFIKTAFLAGIETGDLTVSCYSKNHLVTDLLVQGAHLDVVWQETQRGLDFVRKARFRDVEAIIVAQQRFILNLQGLTSTFSTFSDAHFDEQAFERSLTQDRMSTMVCWYWILKMQARFLSGDYALAFASSEKAKALLWASQGHIQLLDYHYYSALTIAALYESSPPETRPSLRAALMDHLEQLREWAAKGSETFADKYKLVQAELARIEERSFDAMQLFEEAIRTAREYGFVQNEAIANELVAEFYAQRGFNKIADVYRRDALACYSRWGAHGKVRQLVRRFPDLSALSTAPNTTSLRPTDEVDLSGVIKASQAVSGEMVLGKLVQKLLAIVVAHAGAERGLLLLPGADGLCVHAEAITGHDGVNVQLRHAPVTLDDLPNSVLSHVVNKLESVLIDDVSLDSRFCSDDYLRHKRSKSILCLPLAKQAQLVGVLYLENSLTPGAFTPDRMAMLNVLASQAAISLENARLYSELSEEKARLRTVIQQVPAGLIIAEAPSGRFIIVNDQVEAVLHNRVLPSESIERYSDYVGFRSDGRRYEPSEWPLARSILKGETVQNEEAEMLRPDGSRGWVTLNSTPIRDSEGKITAGVVILQDITDRKRSERELRLSEARFSKAFHNSPAPMAIIRPRDGVFVDANENFLRMLSLTRPELIGRSATELGSAFVQLLARLERTISSGGALQHEEFVMTSNSGESRILLLAQEAIELEGESCSLVAFTDVTEKKRVDEQLLQSQKLEAIGSLAGGIAHDFNNLLTVINGYSDMALMRLAEPDPLRELIDEIRKAGDRAAGLTHKLLAFSRKEVIEPRVWRLSTIVTDMLGMLRRLIEENVELVTRLSAGDALINADRGQVEQIILNLVVNARDAMPNGGKLTLETYIATIDGTSRDTALGAEAGTYVALAVSDTGTGMTPEIQRQVFEPFFTTKPVGKGTGLGLAVVYGIVKQSQGNVSLSSAPGQGTRVRVLFPRIEHPAPEEPAAARSLRGSFGGDETILVAEDDESLGQFVESALELEGYRVVRVRNGREALALLDRGSSKIDGIITDVVMPDVGGRELGRQIRERNQSLPILYISGYAKDFGLTDNQGTSEYFLAKPFGPLELAMKLRHVLDRSKLRR